MTFPFSLKKITALAALLTAAVVAVCVLSGCGSGKPGDGGESGSDASESTKAPETSAPGTDAPGSDAPETDAPGTDAPETDAPETDTPAPEPHDVVSEGAIYRVYGDHAVLTGTDLSDAFRSEVEVALEIEGVPVTDMEDDAFKSDERMCVICSASSAIYEKVRSCAIARDKIFLESDSGKLPDHYYPDWVEKLDWYGRDRTNDKYVAVDDNARITELVVAYLGGDKSVYDELLRRVLYRAACTERFAFATQIPEEFCCWLYDPDPDGAASSDFTDQARYEYIYDGIPAYFQYAYGDIDTYDEFYDYICTFYT